ncbi:hypothetical protein ANCCEY_05046 [Ancylostoma ceylanicum]|uniref:Potassium channel tetramerisation-type BTB domain-containing protein n=1 Tax=Ancylostoma ceylanicum TaxID=53326 RepID=A0A0D6M0L9_9BILA|nr:hypothetical protein ANCCEY_05046 [Ancylostoma ceylanicum]
MNTAVLQGSIMATSHGITRLNRHRHGRGYYVNSHDRLGYRLRKRVIRGWKKGWSKVRNNRSDSINAGEDPPLLQNCSHPAELGTTPRGISVDSAKSKEFLRVNVGGQRFMLKKETISSRKVGEYFPLLHSGPTPLLFRTLLYSGAFLKCHIASGEYFIFVISCH